MKCIKQFMGLGVMGSLLGLTGCVGYHAGPTNGLPAGSRSVRVKFFDNETLEPRLVVAVNRALKRNLQQDGTYTLETQGEADLVVSGQLTKFLRNGISYTPGDSLVVQDYTMQLTARIKVADRATGQVVYEGDVTGKTIVRVGDDLTSAQRQAIPLIAENLARQATSFVVDGHWPDKEKAQ
jgi:ubiquinone biosynthesis protein UbiJ